MGCGSSKHADGSPQPPSAKFLSAQPSLTHGFYGHFPTTFSIYFAGCRPFSHTDFFVLASEDAGPRRPLCAFVVHKGIANLKLQLKLYSGTDRSSAALGTAGKDGLRALYSFISLPAATAVLEGSTSNRIELLTHSKDFNRHGFCIAVGRSEGASRHAETFEWRGDKLLIATGKDVSPWTLVRVDAGGGGGSNPTGEEVVGMWIELPKPDNEGKLGTFHFQGSGTTGELGQYWTLMAVMTLLRLFQSKWELHAWVNSLTKAGGSLAFGGLGLAPGG